MAPSFILLDTSYPINTRNQKLIHSLRTHYPDSEIHILTWNRDNRPLATNETNQHIYYKAAAYGNLLKKLRGLIGYKKYLKSVLQTIKPDVIIASHWDTLMLAAPLKKEKQLLIYENLDIPTSSHPFILKILQYLEKRALRHTDLIIQASRFFVHLYETFPVCQLVLENKPLFKDIPSHLFPKNHFRISFMGMIRYPEILKNLIDGTKDLENVELCFYGEGPDFKEIESYCQKRANIHLYGKYEYEQIGEFYLNSDLIWAVYPNKDYNVKYAISNKFHESLFFKRPCVFAQETRLGDFVTEKQIGFTVDPYDPHKIHGLLSFLCKHPEQLKDMEKNIEIFYNQETDWKTDFSQFKDYLDRHLSC